MAGAVPKGCQLLHSAGLVKVCASSWCWWGRKVRAKLWVIPEDAPPATQQLCPEQPGSPSQPPGTTSCSLKSFQRLALPLEHSSPSPGTASLSHQANTLPSSSQGVSAPGQGTSWGHREAPSTSVGSWVLGCPPLCRAGGIQEGHSPIHASIPSLCWGPAERGAVLGVGDEPIPGGIQLQAGLNGDPVLLCPAPLQGSVTGRGSDTGESQEELIPQPGRG